MVIWNALFSVVFIGLLVSIGCAILFALLKNSIYAKMFVKIAAGMFALCLGCVMMERSWRSEPEQPAATMDTSSLPEPTGPRTQTRLAFPRPKASRTPAATARFVPFSI